MPSFLMNEWFMIPAVAVCVFLFVFANAERSLNFLYRRSLGQREEVMKLLKLMSVEVDEKQVTWAILLISFGMGGLFFILFWPSIFMGLFFGGIVTIAGWSIPLLVVKYLYEKRCTQFVDQMVDGLTIMANGIKSGSNSTQAMERVIDIMGNPISQEFRQVITQHQFGQSFEESLLDLGERIPRPDVQMFVTAINILKETGGNLAETFETIVTTIRERQKVEKKIQALTAQGLMQGAIVTMIPFILAIVFLIIDPNFVKPMFNTPLGLVLLLGMLGLQIIGGVLIKKIVTIKV
ncbi:type II secretion system F family protein [Bdellovibrio sp. HCB337]|uniref:type II secretion system F family protein n=1 Tax=Bdellovibrio sp. HCB337 TaxID=3394358 RepID=UPI0039A4D507